MSDQALEQSPQEKLMAMLDEVPEEQEALQAIEEQLDDVEDTEELEESETEESQETDDDTEDEEPEAEKDDESEDSENEQPKSVRLKVNGEELEKPLDEVIALAQQGLDYTKKTQEVAEQRKALEEYAQTIQVQEQKFNEALQLNQALISEVAQLTNIDNQLAQFNDVNWQELSDTDFVEAQKLFFTYNQLQQQRSTVAQDLSQKQQQLQQQQAQSVQERIAKGKEILAKEIPNWSRDTSQAIISTGKEYGFTDDELGMIVDPRHVKVLHDAMQWRKLQSNSVVKNKVSQAKPVVKPGAKDTKQEATSAKRQVRDQLRKTGKSDLAQKLIEDMI
jgi:chemotaxis protein histidine kinase CheA